MKLRSRNCRVLLLMASAVLSACGGSSDQTDDTPQNTTVPSVSAGQFVDAPVVGLRYQTETQSGETNQYGRFSFIKGETVSFYIGDQLLGSTIAKNTVTPLDLVPEAKRFVDSLEVSNILRLLQTLDADNTDNVIELTEAAHQAFIGTSYDLTLPFDSTLEQQLAQIMVQQPNGAQQLVSAADAQAHFVETLQQFTVKPEYDFDTDGDGIGDKKDPYPLHNTGDEAQANEIVASFIQSGFVPFKGDVAQFTPLWNVQTGVYSTERNIKAFSQNIMFDMSNKALSAYQNTSGEILWSYDFSLYSNVWEVKYEADKLYVLVSDIENHLMLLSLDSQSGELIAAQLIADGFVYSGRLFVQSGLAYIFFDGEQLASKLLALKLDSAEIQFEREMTRSVASISMINDDLLLQMIDGGVELWFLSAENGSVKEIVRDVPIDGYNDGYFSIYPLLMDNEQVLVRQNSHLYSYSFEQLQQTPPSLEPEWSLSLNRILDTAMDEQFIYILQDNALQIRDKRTSELLHNVDVTAEQILLTLDYIWLRGNTGITVLNKDDLSSVWQYDCDATSLYVYNGILFFDQYIEASNESALSAIDLVGDLDGNGLPELWESQFEQKIDLTQDQDGDGLLPLQEFEYRSSPFDADSDGDGLSDYDEVWVYETNPILSDSDNDGLTDAQEIQQYDSNPLQRDSDVDGLTDDIEVMYGLDPQDSSDALADLDGDGFSNLHEVLANTDINDALFFPQSEIWAQVAGNSARSSAFQVVLNHQLFSKHWQNTFDNDINHITIGESLVYVVVDDQLFALSPISGEIIWKYRPSTYYNGRAAVYSSGRIYWQFRTEDAYHLVALNADSGDVVFQYTRDDTSYNQNFYLMSVSEGRLYLHDNQESLCLDAASGEVIWEKGAVILNAFPSLPAISDEELFLIGGNTIHRFDIGTGDASGVITTDFSLRTFPILGSNHNLILNDETRLLSLDYDSKEVIWSKRVDYSSSGRQVAVASGQVFIISDDITLSVIDELTGQLQWVWQNDFWSGLDENIIVTATHVFVQDWSTTYAIDLHSHKKVWEYNAAGPMAISSNVLYIADDEQLVAIDLGLDNDQDGISDLWEQKFSLNLVATDDLDQDLLTNLQEFEQRLDPLNADVDQDGLLDGEEVLTYKTSAHESDTDGDQLSDSFELRTSMTDPLSNDSDGDGFKDGFEVLLFATDPNDAAQQPSPLDFWTRDFTGLAVDEGMTLPLSSEQTAWQVIDTQDAAYGQSLSAMLEQNEQAELVLKQYFQAGVLSYSIGYRLTEPSISAAVRWQLYVNGRAVDTAFTSLDYDGNMMWGYISTPIPEGIHTIRLTFESHYTDVPVEVVVDNIAFIATALQDGVDLDGDGMDDLWERRHGGDLVATGDEDQDGLDNLGEFETGADPFIVDSDGDGLSDGIEVHQYGSQPALADSDQDRLADADELIYGTDLNNPDSDQDGTIDGVEVYVFDTDPTDAASFVSPYVLLNESFDDYVLDSSIPLPWLDMMPEGSHWQVKENPMGNGSPALAANMEQGVATVAFEGNFYAGMLSFNTSNSDNYVILDVLVDGEVVYNRELAYYNGMAFIQFELGEGYHRIEWRFESVYSDHTVYIDNVKFEAFDIDSDLDGDGMIERWEYLNGGNLQPNEDLDQDGLTNLQEFSNYTHPRNADTDADTLSDGDEVNVYGTSPISFDSDNDGLLDQEELQQYGTDPVNADSDQDHFSDGFEVLQQTDPNDATSVPEGAFTETFEAADLSSDWLLDVVGSNANWLLDTAQASDGVQSLRAGVIGDGQYSAVQYPLNGIAGMTLSFDYYLEAETCCDYLTVYLDGDMVGNYSNGGQWQSVQLTLAQDVSVIEWRYHKDGSVSSGADTVWIDNVQLMPDSDITTADLPIYLRGNIVDNDWNALPKGRFSASIGYDIQQLLLTDVAAGDYQFKLASDDWDVYHYGCVSGLVTLDNAVPEQLATEDFSTADYVANCAISIPFAGSYRFVFDSVNETIQVFSVSVATGSSN